MIDVVLPVLDEAQAIPWVLGRMQPGYRPIVVDNGSTDGSAAVAESLGAIVITETQRGFGAACYAGLVAASSPIVCFMDCDGSLDPVELPLVAAPVQRGEADLVLGARTPEPRAWPLHARLANRLLARSIRRRTNLAVTDLGAMRAARRDALIDLQLTDRRSGWPLEMVLSAHGAGWSIIEVDVRYLRRTGRSKVTGTIRGTLQTVTDMRAQLAATGE